MKKQSAWVSALLFIQLSVCVRNGKQVYWHTGGAFGFVANTCFLPEPSQ